MRGTFLDVHIIRILTHWGLGFSVLGSPCFGKLQCKRSYQPVWIIRRCRVCSVAITGSFTRFQVLPQLRLQMLMVAPYTADISSTDITTVATTTTAAITTTQATEIPVNHSYHSKAYLTTVYWPLWVPPRLSTPLQHLNNNVINPYESLPKLGVPFGGPDNND